MNQKYLNEIKEEANRLVELTDNPYCQGPVSLLNGVKHVIPILLEKVDELQLDYNKIVTENVTLKRALELACNDAADEQCPHEFDLYTCNKCADCPHDSESHTDSGRDAQCWYDYYVHQAQEARCEKQV